MSFPFSRAVFVSINLIYACFGQEKRLMLHSNEDIIRNILDLKSEMASLQTTVKKLQNTSHVNDLMAKIQSLETTVARLRTTNNSTTDLTAKVRSLETTVAKLQAKDIATTGSGSVYVRWGHKTCPGNGTSLVYSGYAGGSMRTDTGAAANYICLAPDPLWSHYNDAVQNGAKVYGAEYEMNYIRNMASFTGKNLQEDDVPCAVCRSSRPTSVMIPGRNRCYDDWTLEYAGYLSAGYPGHAAASEYVCLDEQLDYVVGSIDDKDGKLFYFAEGVCGSLPCPPYVNGRELTCSVCTK